MFLPFITIFKMLNTIFRKPEVTQIRSLQSKLLGLYNYNCLFLVAQHKLQVEIYSEMIHFI